MLRIFLLIFALILASFSEEVKVDDLGDLLKYAPSTQKSKNSGSSNKRIPVRLSDKEIESKESLSLDDLSMIAPSDEIDLAKSNESFYEEVRVKKLTLKTSNVAKSVYIDQIFKIDFKADIGQDLAVDLNLTMAKNESLKWLNEKNLNWIKGNGVFEVTLWFLATDKDAKLDSITLSLDRNGEFFQSESISPKLPNFMPLQNKENFANIAADELLIKSYKASKFDDNSNLLTINLNSKNADLLSFKVENPAILKQGVDSVRGEFLNQNGYYFAVIDNKIKNFSFNYFNLKSKKFENFALEISIIPEDLSTQIGLNPKESKFELYKDIAIYGLAGLLLVMFIASKNITPLIFAVIILLASFLLRNPYGKGVVEKNVAIKILPISSSTIFYVTKEAEKVEIFEQNEKYYKIMLANGKIGWVDKDDLKRD